MILFECIKYFCVRTGNVKSTYITKHKKTGEGSHFHRPHPAKEGNEKNSDNNQ